MTLVAGARFAARLIAIAVAATAVTAAPIATGARAIAVRSAACAAAPMRGTIAPVSGITPLAPATRGTGTLGIFG